MLRRLTLTCLLVTPLLAFAAPDQRQLPAFQSIASQGAYKLVVNVGPAQTVVVSADDPLLPQISTKVVGNELVIAMPEGKNQNWSDKVLITISTPRLSKLSLEGVGSTQLNNLAGDQFELNYQGVGSLTATGKVRLFVLKASGVGSIQARHLEAQQVDATLEGVGSAQVRASELLNARVEGVGSLIYFGHPKQVNKSAQGIGHVGAGD